MNYKNLEQKEGVIKVDGFDTGFLDTPTYAIVWFDCGVPIIAEGSVAKFENQTRPL